MRIIAPNKSEILIDGVEDKNKIEIKEGSMAQYFEKDPLCEDTIGKDCLLPINF
jgi:hypothetical protein